LMWRARAFDHVLQRVRRQLSVHRDSMNTPALNPGETPQHLRLDLP
jgi:hypothetical protein